YRSRKCRPLGNSSTCRACAAADEAKARFRPRWGFRRARPHARRLGNLIPFPAARAGAPDKRDGLRYLALMQPITTTKKLADACARMARHPFVTVDTEFLRESTYYPRLCVAQMASPEEAVVIDALADVDFAPFFALMADENVVKVFHAARQDIEICWHEAGLIPFPIVATQGSAKVLRARRVISYAQLVQRITGDNLDKSHRFTDWTRRPLTEAQLAYAISDVTHLRDVYLNLSTDLEKRGRNDWMREEMKVLTSPATYRFEPEHAWERLKTRVRKPKELAVLIEAAACGEREAQERDVPRGRVLKDDVIGEIAVQAPTTVERLAGLRSLPKGFERSKWGE